MVRRANLLVVTACVAVLSTAAGAAAQLPRYTACQVPPPADVERACSEIIDKPQDGERMYLGSVYLRRGIGRMDTQRAEALADFGEANRHLSLLLLNPNVTAETKSQVRKVLANSHSLLGIVQTSTGDVVAGRQSHEMALRINPNDPIVQARYGAFLMEQLEFPAAITAFDHALRLDPRNVIALCVEYGRCSYLRC